MAPALALMLQIGQLHRLIALITFPLTFLYLAMYPAISMQRYAEEERKERRTMLVRMGWQRGMSFHNLLILLAFLLMGDGGFAGPALAADLAWATGFAYRSLPNLAGAGDYERRADPLAIAGIDCRGYLGVDGLLLELRAVGRVDHA